MKVLSCLMQNLFDEFQSFTKYPDKAVLESCRALDSPNLR